MFRVENVQKKSLYKQEGALKEADWFEKQANSSYQNLFRREFRESRRLFNESLLVNTQREFAYVTPIV